MDHIKSLVDSFSKEEKKEFGNFVNRMRQRKGRKDLELFELLTKPEELKTEEILRSLYGKVGNKTAYHALRKRLRKHMMDYILLRNQEIDETGGAESIQLLGLANHLFHRNSNESAWFYLKKAETLATKSEEFAVLTQIYLKMLEFCHLSEAVDYHELVRLYESSRKQRREDEQAELALAHIRHHLREQQMRGTESDLNEMVKAIIEKYDLSDKYRSRPKLFYTVMSMIRSSYLGRNEIGAFPRFLKGEFERFEWEKGFSEQHAFYRSQLLYMLSHVFYRAWEFEPCEKYLGLLEESLEGAAKRYKKLLEAKALMIKTSALLYQGSADQAVEILRSAIPNKTIFNDRQRLNMRMHLSLCLFCIEKYDEVLDVYLDLHHTDHWLAKKMGREWLYKKFLIEIITHYELGNEELVLNRMRSIERQYSDLKSIPIYARALKFLQLLKKIFREPEWLTPETLENIVDKELGVESEALEDSQQVTFYAYVRAKAYDLPFYDVLINIFQKGEHF